MKNVTWRLCQFVGGWWTWTEMFCADCHTSSACQEQDTDWYNLRRSDDTAKTKTLAWNWKMTHSVYDWKVKVSMAAFRRKSGCQVSFFARESAQSCHIQCSPITQRSAVNMAAYLRMVRSCWCFLTQNVWYQVTGNLHSICECRHCHYM